MEPNEKKVLAAMARCAEVGEAAFVKRVSAGNGWRSHVVVHKERAYPLKAVWADAHDPTVSPRNFNTKDAVQGLQYLGFYCFKLLPEA